MKDKEKQIFDKYGNYDFPTEIKQDGLNTATSQIEEMAKDMADCNITCNECFEQLESVMTMKIKKRADHCQAYNYAERLYNAGYRKLPEDSVVLSKEELKGKYVPKSFYELAKKVHEEKVEELENLTRYWRENWKQARKETAEKFYEFAKAWFKDDEQNDYFEEVKNFAKQFGAKKKE